jgi:hypothetical protein
MAFLRQAGSSTADRELTRAVRRIREVYGTDLKSFFEDAQRAAAENDQETPKVKAEPNESIEQEP